MFTNWKTRRLQRKHQRCIANIRKNLAWLGYDTSDLTNEDIEKATASFASVVCRIGFSAEGFANAMRIVLNRLRETNHE